MQLGTFMYATVRVDDFYNIVQVQSDVYTHLTGRLVEHQAIDRKVVSGQASSRGPAVS